MVRRRHQEFHNAPRAGCVLFKAGLVFPLLRKFLLLLASATIVSGCERMSGGIIRLTSVNSISGSVLPLQSLSSSALRAPSAVNSQSCSSATASLYQLSSSGVRVSPALKTVDVASDGTYTFSNVKSLGVQLNADGLVNGAYLIEATACTDTYSRPVTHANQQNLSVGSTLVGYVQSSSQASKLASADHSKLQSLINNLEGFGTYTLAYNHLISDSSTQQIFQDLFVSAPTILQDSAPQTAVITVPATAHENESVPLTMDVSHWKSDYSFAYLWEIDGTPLATTRNATYTTHANSQGKHVIKVSYGSDNGGGILDQTKPFHTQSLTIDVSNDVLPQPPALSVVGSSTLTTNIVTLQISTGASLANCQSFSALALTEEEAAAPSSPLDYTLTCTQSPTQNFTHTLTTSGTGTKTLRLWARDAQGNISASSQSVVVSYNGPVLNFTSPAVQNHLTNGNTATFAGNCETGLTITVAGGVDALTTSCTSGNWTYTTASRSTDSTRTYTFTQTDPNGNSSTITGTWQRDTIAPALILTSPAAGSAAQSGLTLAGTCETGRPIQISGTGLLGNVVVACSAGTYSQYVYFSAGDGTKSISLAQTDVAGNTTTLTRSFTRDTTAPTLTVSQTLPYLNATNTATFSGACEAGVSINIAGADGAKTTTCTSGSWSYTTATQTSDANRAYTFSQTDPSGNIGQISANWVRDTAAPALTFSSSSSFLTSSNSVTFQGGCETGLTLTVSGSASTSLSCVGGLWSYTASNTTDGSYTYNFTQTDLVGNSATLNGTWQRSTVGPTISITQATPQLTTSGTLTISGTCSGGGSGIQSFNVSGAVSSTPVTCSSNAFSYVASQSSDGNHTYDFIISDNLNRSSTATLVWQRDTTSPAVTSLAINGGQLTTNVSYNPVNFTATDNLSTVAKFCLKLSSTAPSGSDSCWYPVNGANANGTPSNTFTLSNYLFPIGIIPQVYTVYLWVMDGAGHVSTLSNAGSGTEGQDKATITLQQVAAPITASVLVSNLDTMNGALSERTIPAGNTVYIRWSASGSFLSGTPIQLFFTTDDINWTPIISGLSNGQNNCTSLKGSGTAAISATGCYKWDAGSPTSAYYRVRAAVTNTLNMTSFASSLPINAADIDVIAGNTDGGLNGAATSAVFLAPNGGGGTYLRPYLLAVTSRGVVYFNDASKGLVAVNPEDGVLRQLIKLDSSCVVNDSRINVASACLKSAEAIALDFNEDLWVFDHDRIRRINLQQSPATIETVIGGGSTTITPLANARSLKITPPNSIENRKTMSFLFLPNNDLIFNADLNSYTHNSANTVKRTYIFRAGTGAVDSFLLTGTGIVPAPSQDLSQCGSVYPGYRFDPTTKDILEFQVSIRRNTNYATCSATSEQYSPTRLNPATWVSTGSSPTATGGASFDVLFTRRVTSRSGDLYAHGKSRIWKYNPSANSWGVVYGNSSRGTCDDGTLGTNCPAEIDDVFIRSDSQVFFYERGRIRTLDADNKVVTLYGQALAYGDGGLAVNARFNEIGMIQKAPNGRIGVLDENEYKLREFVGGGNINTIIGNGLGGYAVLGEPALTQPMALTATTYDIAYFGYVSNSDVVMNAADLKQLNRWIRSTGVWSAASSDRAGAGSTEFTSGSGLAGSAIKTTSGRFLISGASGDIVLNHAYGVVANATKDPWIILHDVSDSFKQTNLIFRPTTGNSPTAVCASGTSASNCGLPASQGTPAPWAFSQFSPYENAWLLLYRIGATSNQIRTASVGGTVETLVTLQEAAVNFIRVGFTAPTRDYLYYCSAVSGRIRRADFTNPASVTEIELPWPVPSMICDGKALVFDSSGSTPKLIFNFEQNGLQGVAEHLNIQ